MSTHKLIASALLLMLVLAITGCGREDFPKASIQPTTEFSLGSTKIEPLKNPSAKELYDAVIKMYDSFQSVSATYTMSKYSYPDWQLDDNDNIIIKNELLSPPKADFWMLNPSKSIRKMEEEPRVRIFQDGKDVMIASVDLHEYQKLSVDPALKAHQVTRIFGLLPDNIINHSILSHRTISKLTLLPDANINGTDVYVLEMSLPAETTKRHMQSAELRRFYIGKTDLLPRKIQLITRSMSSKTLDDSGKLQELVFAGFKCNPELPNDVFTLTPPANWKVKKEEVPDKALSSKDLIPPAFPVPEMKMKNGTAPKGK